MRHYSLSLYIAIFSNSRARNLFLRMILIVIVGYSIVTLSNEIFPTILKIRHIDNKVQATISKRDLPSFFRMRITTIQNVKEAIIERKLFSGTNYIVLLKDKAGKKYTINPRYSESEEKAKLLSNRITTSIKGNVDFKFEIIDKVRIVWSIIGMIISSMILYFWMLYDKKHPKKAIRILTQDIPEEDDEYESEEEYEKDDTGEIDDLKNYPVSEGELERQALESQDSIEEPKKNDDERYKDINNSIIK